MKLRHQEQNAQPTHKRPGAVSAFASAAVLVTGIIFGCEQPTSKELEVKCHPCSNCAVPAEAAILPKGETIRAPGFIGVSLTANDDGSISASMSGSVAQHAFVSERTDFAVEPGDVCSIRVSGNEAFELYKPRAFVSEPSFVYPASQRSRL